ncbi:glycosyltransferase family 39 protein [Nonomuraea sp. NPDC050663]|uniref:glycosyltransferase family 39 protein n=1 Tax=Nonomuraea sp. NPDC050663 TaxID=3364370 RepID=UPI0037A479EC
MTSTPTLTRPVLQSARRRLRLWPLPVAVVTVVTLIGFTTATLNGDELATLSAARRSLPDLWTLAQNIDGHFLPYYVFMHVWLKFGHSELWLRLPSLIAIAVATGFLADLGRRAHTALTGLIAGLLFALLPTTSYFAAFARSYSFAAAAVVFSFWALHRATGRRDRGPWLLYGLSVALIPCTHLFAVLTLPAHLIFARGERRVLFGLATGAVPAAALGLLGYGERHAISWIQQRGPDVLLKFPDMVAGAALPGLILFILALTALLHPHLLRRSPHPAASQGPIQAVAHAQAEERAGERPETASGAHAGERPGTAPGAQARERPETAPGTQAGSQPTAQAGALAGPRAESRTRAEAGARDGAEAGAQAGSEAGAQAGARARAEAGARTAGRTAGPPAPLPWILAWLLLPPPLLLAISHLLTPAYVDRYLFVTAPALALAAALALSELAKAPAIAALAVVTTAASAVPQHADIREPNGRFDNIPWAISRLDPAPGDALVYGQSQIRAGFLYYARRGTLPDDVLLQQSAPAATGFGYPEARDTAEALQGRDRVWAIWRGSRTKAQSLPRMRSLDEAGFTMKDSWQSGDTPGLTVALFVRNTKEGPGGGNLPGPDDWTG